MQRAASRTRGSGAAGRIQDPGFRCSRAGSGVQVAVGRIQYPESGIQDSSAAGRHVVGWAWLEGPPGSRFPHTVTHPHLTHTPTTGVPRPSPLATHTSTLPALGALPPTTGTCLPTGPAWCALGPQYPPLHGACLGCAGQCVPEGPVEGRGVLGGVGHDGHVRVALTVQGTPNSPHPPIHHVARGHTVSPSLGLRHRLPAGQNGTQSRLEGRGSGPGSRLEGRGSGPGSGCSTGKGAGCGFGQCCLGVALRDRGSS